MINWFINLFDSIQLQLFENIAQPFMFYLGLGNLLEDGFAATGWLMVGILELMMMLMIIAPLQKWKPVEKIVDQTAIRVDIIYTLIHRLGLFRVGLFFTLMPLLDRFFGFLTVSNIPSFQLDQIYPSITENPIVSFVIYLLVFDLLDYLIHRAQHQFNWWWALHSLHHSQRQMTMWTDNRNHLLDSILRDFIFAIVAYFIGIAPGQFVAIVALTQLSESFQHANLKLSFGLIGERLWVSPRFHRMHHSIGIGHETKSQKNTLGGVNFGVLLPWWDILFRTANFEYRFDPTGVRDQVEPDEKGQLRDYGTGFWSQQYLGILRLFKH